MKPSDIFNVNEIFESYEDSIARAKQFLELSNHLFAQSKTETDPAKKEALVQKSNQAHAVWMKLKDRAYGRASQDEKNAQAMQTMSGAARDYAKAKPGQYMGDDIENPGMAEGFERFKVGDEISFPLSQMATGVIDKIDDKRLYVMLGNGKVYTIPSTMLHSVKLLEQGVAEAIGDEFSTQLAHLIFKADPTLDSDEAILKAGYAIANKKDNYTGFFRDHDFLSDLVSSYHDLQQEDYYSLPMQHGDREDEGTDYKQMFESKLTEMSSSCVGTNMSVGNPKAGSLFGGKYTNPNNPFAKKQTKKRTGKMNKR
jgi:hypothetical protein